MSEQKKIKVFMVVIAMVSALMLFAAIVILPQLVDFSVSTFTEIAYLAKPVAIIVIISAIPFFVVLFETFRICLYILQNDIFTIKPLRALNIISIASFLISILYTVIVVLFLNNDFFTPLLAIILSLVILASFIIGIFSQILHILVKKATVLKIDNDLTIWGVNMIIINLDIMLAKRKMTVTELSEKVGITLSNISILKNNKAKAIRFSTLDAICEALDCQPGDILEYVIDDKEEEVNHPWSLYFYV